MNIKNTFIVLFIFMSVNYGQTALFPVVPDWQLTPEAQVYDSNNLWDLIDGAADLFLEYSFVDLHLARYKGLNDIEIRAELYKHATSLDAFGIYSQERDPGYKYIKIGVQGYIEEGVLNFLDGIYYVKLSTLQKGNAAQDALMLIAQKLDEHLKQDNAFPQVLNYFPQELKVQNTEKYILRNYLGYSFLKSVITVQYDAKAPFTAFVINAGTNENASTVLGQFLEAVNNSKPVKLAGNHYQINEQQLGMIDIDLQGQFLYGSINCNDKTKKDDLLVKIKILLGKN